MRSDASQRRPVVAAVRRGKHERCARHPVPIADGRESLVVMVDHVCTGVCWFARRFTGVHLDRAEASWITGLDLGERS